MNAALGLIAVVEDEAPIRRFLAASLRAEGFEVAEATSAKEGIRIVTQQSPTLTLLDLGLPDADGIQLIVSIREWSQMPIIVISARGEENAKIAALDAGADDYLTKPFGVGELLARVRVALRHSALIERGGEVEPVVRFGAIAVDLASRVVTRADCEVKLTKIEFDLLAALVRHSGKVLTHKQILKEVWGPHAVHEPHYVRVFMSNLRKKLEENPSRPQYLITEQGVGYRLREASGELD